VTIGTVNGSFETTELVETFGLAPGYRVADTLTYDSNGNLTYDGLQAYTYDAWNRLKTVAHAYRDGSGVHSGKVFATMGYDADGRQVTKANTGMGMDDCTYHYYRFGSPVVEEWNRVDSSGFQMYTQCIPRERRVSALRLPSSW
jgi:hypothetical protein